MFEFGCKQQSPSEADLCKRLALPGRGDGQLTESRRRADSLRKDRLGHAEDRVSRKATMRVYLPPAARDPDFLEIG